MSDYSNYQAKNCTNPLADMLIRRKLTNVEHRDGAYILKLVDMGGGYQPVRIPDSFGYEPKLGMQVIWDTDDYSPAADLSLYDESGKLLFPCIMMISILKIGKMHGMTQLLKNRN